MEVFIVEWLVWYAQVIDNWPILLSLYAHRLVAWAIFGMHKILNNWMVGMHKILLPLNGCYGMHKILKILHSLTHQNITSADEVSYYNPNPLTPLP